MYLAEAEDHEDTEQHVTIVRDLDRAVPPSSPPHASSPPQAQSDPPEISRSSPAPMSSPSQCVSPLSQSSPPQPSSPIYPEIPHGDIFTVQGPYLEGDGDNLIYDNWAGSWGLQMPNSPEDEVISGDETEVEFEGEGECGAEVKDYYGASVEEADLTDNGLQNANPDDWWPWANREVRMDNCDTRNHC
jgi:hypothetical protein